MKHRGTLTESTIIYLIETPGSLESLRISSGLSTCDLLSRNLKVSVEGFLSGETPGCALLKPRKPLDKAESLLLFLHGTMESPKYSYQALLESPHKKEMDVVLFI